MRGLAALAVAAFHLSYSGIPVFRGLTSHGNLGVDFFFVLSGFIIMYAHGRDIGRPERTGRYIWRRFTRIYPIYWLYTAIFLILVSLGLTVGTKLPGSASAWLAAVSLVRLSAAAPLLHPAWTLFHEVGFYALFALLILRRWLGVATLAVWFALCAATFHYTIVPETRTPWLTYTAAHNLNFLAGIIACSVYRRGAPAGRMLALSAGLFLAAVALDFDHNMLSMPAFASAFAALIGGIVMLEARGLRLPAFARLIGDASYSIYLTHEAFESLILKVASAAHVEAVIGRHGFYLAALAVTVIAGVAAYVLIERPLLEFLRTFRSPGAPPILARGAARLRSFWTRAPMREEAGHDGALPGHGEPRSSLSPRNRSRDAWRF
jgi:peptidoglycan/LPS O-acetylase OafA/YrhL